MLLQLFKVKERRQQGNMGKTMTPWGRKCKAQMVMLDKTLADVSREIHLSIPYISSIINGRITVPAETVQLISNALGVEMPSKE